MTFTRKLYYELKVTFGAVMWLPALILPALALFSWYTFNPNNEFTMPMAERIRMIYVFGLPLIAGLSVSHLMSVEREADYDEIRNTFPEPTWHPFVYRLLIGIGAIMVSALITAALYLVVHGQFAFIEHLRITFPSLLILFALSIMSNSLTGNYWVSMGLVVVYWMVDFNSQGKYSQLFYLFQSIKPRPALDASLNTQMLLLGTVLCLAIALIWRYVQRKGILP